MQYFKVEIIIAQTFLPNVIAKLERLGASGFSAMEITQGKGTKRGRQRKEGMLPVTHNSLVFTIAPEPLTVAIVRQLEPYVERHGGLVIAYPVPYVAGLSPGDEPPNT